MEKGFTLIELIGVIIIIGILSLLVTPTIENNLKKSKQRIYDNQISNIESSLTDWATDHTKYLPENEGESITLTLIQLKQGGYVDKDIQNPITKKLFPNDMLLTITLKYNKYVYNVLDDTGTIIDGEVNPNAPIIILNGNPTDYVEVFDTYIDAGVTAITSTGSLIDESYVTTTITGTGTTIDTSNLNKYTITYVVKDPANNLTSTAIRNVVIRDTTKPTLITPPNITLESTSLESFDPLFGASANDNFDGDLTSSIKVGGNLSIIPGTYYLTYSVTDSSKNKTTSKRKIVITKGEESEYTDTSGAPKPEVGDNMIPVIWDTDKWVKADISKQWYDYNNKEWANVVTVTSDTRSTYKSSAAGTEILMDDILTFFVWIPRYKYALPPVDETSGEYGERPITIVFEPKDEKATGDATGTNYKTHPAFTFDGAELDGIWVGKFTTAGDIDNIVIKPKETMITNKNVSTMFNAARNMQKVGNPYGFASTGIDIHMAKNTEWGAAVYLGHSKYGVVDRIWTNSDQFFTTGCGAAWATMPGAVDPCIREYYSVDGMKSSTNGNTTGIYDMSGGAWEIVMGNYNNTISSSGFSSMPDSKYYDLYTSSTGIKGDATNADLNMGGWYYNYDDFITASGPWFIRGGYYYNGSTVGQFCYYGRPGGNESLISFRVVAVEY